MGSKGDLLAGSTLRAAGRASRVVGGVLWLVLGGQMFGGGKVAGEEGALARLAHPVAGAAGEVVRGWNGGGFDWDEGEVVVWMGQTNAVRAQERGEPEASLALAMAAGAPRFRSMAWEADTVREQWRDLNFGSWAEQLEAVGASIVIAWFGQAEALEDGPDLGRLAGFVSGYEHLLDQVVTRTRRIVLLGTFPFEEGGARELGGHDVVVEAYRDAIAGIAARRGLLFVDLYGPLAGRMARGEVLTENGIHLNEAGLGAVADALVEGLGLGVGDGTGERDLVRRAVVRKNWLWAEAWRPANWPFVYGDRSQHAFGTAAGGRPQLAELYEASGRRAADLDGVIAALARGERSEGLVAAIEPDAFEPPATEARELGAVEQLAGFEVAEGYEVGLWACEELGVEKPVWLTWDERGRMFVACSPSYPHSWPGQEGGDFVLMLEDRDGDGVADKAVRFAEGLRMVQGMAVGDGGIYVCDYDRLLFLKDTDGDGEADERRVILSGFGVGDTHQLINSAVFGLDGGLWFSQGLHAFSRVETPWGIVRMHKAGLWRLDRRTLKLEAFFGGGRAGHNCWGVVFDDYGQVFHKSGDRPAGYFSVPGLLPLVEPEEYHGVGALFETHPKTTGIEIIGTRGLPDEIQGHVLIGGYMGHVVEMHRLIDDGAGFRSEQLPRLLSSSDSEFRPVVVRVGPDGAIYVADWFNAVIGHYQASYADPGRDRTRGRIWRVTAEGHDAVDVRDLGAMGAGELVALLAGSEERWERAEARRLLAEWPDASEVTEVIRARLPDLGGRGLVEVGGLLRARGMRGDLAVEIQAKLAASEDGRVRAFGARLFPEVAGEVDLGVLLDLAGDEVARVRLEAVVASGWLAARDALRVVDVAMGGERDRFIDYALRQVAQIHGAEWEAILVADEGVQEGAGRAAVEELMASRPAPVPEGRLLYEAVCLNCHQPDGEGLAGIYPALRGSPLVGGAGEGLVKILLHGYASGEGGTGGLEAGLTMPPVALDDGQVAAVLNYVREHLGGGAGGVTAEQVARVRAETEGRSAPWRPEELVR